MKPEADQILGISAGQLLAGVVPLLPNAYAQGSTAMLSFLILFAAQEYERGAEIRVADNADMRAVFGELSPLVADRTLQAKLADAASSVEPSLLISALDTYNAGLRALLIALHAYLETADGTAARDGERRVWQVLKASATRRLLKTPGS